MVVQAASGCVNCGARYVYDTQLTKSPSRHNIHQHDARTNIHDVHVVEYKASQWSRLALTLVWSVWCLTHPWCTPAMQGNKVAVKMLNLEKAGPEVRSALQQEALIMSELRHPCIARVYGETWCLVSFLAAHLRQALTCIHDCLHGSNVLCGASTSCVLVGCQLHTALTVLCCLERLYHVHGVSCKCWISKYEKGLKSYWHFHAIYISLYDSDHPWAIVFG
jgi:hypothetical protein